MYFNDFPFTGYKFGNETTENLFPNLSVYIDIIDGIKDSVDFYTFYDLKDERPDQLSTLLYDDPRYHWTFFMMNDKIRRQGWPLSDKELEERIKKLYHKDVITTLDDFASTGKFLPGNTVRGSTSGASGVVTNRSPDLGQIFVHLDSGSNNFVSGEIVIDNTDPLNLVTITSDTAVQEYNAVRYYLDANGERVDIDPSVGPGSLVTAVTYLDSFVEENDSLRKIKVIKPDALGSIVSAFNKALRNS